MSHQSSTHPPPSVAGPNRSGYQCYLARVTEFIPTHVIGAWLASSALIADAENVRQDVLLWISFAAGLVLTALASSLRSARQSQAATRTVVSCGSFAVWVFAAGGPFAGLAFYRPLYGSLLLIFYSAGTGILAARR